MAMPAWIRGDCIHRLGGMRVWLGAREDVKAEGAAKEKIEVIHIKKWREACAPPFAFSSVVVAQ